MIIKDNFCQMHCLKRTLDKQTDREMKKTSNNENHCFFSLLKLSSIYYEVQSTVTVESAIFKLLTVWHFDAQMNGPV